MSKPTMQDIADALGVSRITVWKAMNNRDGVSDEMRAKILETSRTLGYSKVPPLLERTISPEITDKGEAEHTVAVVVSRPESSTFWMQIIHHIAKELSKFHVNMMYTYLPTVYTPSYRLPAAFGTGEVSGFIVLNVYDSEFIRRLSELSLPKVFLDTTTNFPYRKLAGDVLYIEGRASVREITERLLDTGHNRIGFVGDVGYAQTNMDRYEGFLDAFKERDLSVDPAYCMIHSLGLKTHYEELSRFLDFLPSLPDAFVCASDYIAHFITQYFEDRNISERNRPLLTGFDNSTEYGNVAGVITTVEVDTIAVGTRLAAQILYDINHPDAACEISYLLTHVIFRGKLS